MSNIEIPPSTKDVLTEVVENATAAGKNLYEAFQDFLGFPNSNNDRNIDNEMKDKLKDKAGMPEKKEDSENTKDDKGNREWPDWN